MPSPPTRSRVVDRAATRWLTVALVVSASCASASFADATTLAVPATYATVQAALDAATAGDTIEVDAGVYNEKLRFVSSGNALDGPIVLRAAPAAVTAPVIDGTGVAGDDLLLIDGKSFVSVIGLELRENLGVNDGSGIRILGSGTDIEIRDNLIHDVRGQNAMGITVYGTEVTPIENLVIDGNTIYDCEPKPSEALVLNGNVRAFEVTDNLVRDVNNIGIDFIGGETDIQPNPALVAREGLCRGNTVLRASGNNFSGGIYVDGGRDIVIENNTVAECDLGIEIGAENAGIVTDGIVVRNNLIHSNLKAGLVFGGYQASVGRASDNEFRGNTLYRNNTLGRSGGGEGEIWIQYGENNVVENNIVYAGTENIFVASFGGSVGTTFNHNLYFSDTGVASGEFSLNDAFYEGLTAWRAATGQDGASLAADPELIDPGSGDFHIASSSPAVDAGNPAYSAATGETDLDGSTRVSGAAVDIGADEASCGDTVVDAGEQCDDGNATEGDGCDSNCTFSACGNAVVAPGEQCDDGNDSAGDCCDASCQFETSGAPCDDLAVCSLVDTCDGAGQCVGDFAPDPACAIPTKAGAARIKLKEKGTKDSLSFKWGKGPALALGELGDPTTGDSYSLCVYRQDGAATTGYLDVLAPAGSSWSVLGDKGFRYKDPDLAPDGVRRADLRSGAEGKSKAKLKGKGAALGLPAPLGLSAAATLYVQLRGAAICLGAVFSPPFQRNDPGQFKDRSD